MLDASDGKFGCQMGVCYFVFEARKSLMKGLT